MSGKNNPRKEEIIWHEPNIWNISPLPFFFLICNWTWGEWKFVHVSVLDVKQHTLSPNSCSLPTHRVSLCSPGCPGTHSVNQAGLDLRDLCASPKCRD